MMSLCPCLTHIIAPLGWGCTPQGMQWQLVSCPSWVVICVPMPTSNIIGFLNQTKIIWHSVTLHLPCGWASHGCTTACSRTMFLDHWGFLCSPISMPYIFVICIFLADIKNMLICPGGSIYLASTCLPSKQAVTLENSSFLGGALFSLHSLPPIFVYLF